MSLFAAAAEREAILSSHRSSGIGGYAYRGCCAEIWGPTMRNLRLRETSAYIRFLMEHQPQAQGSQPVLHSTSRLELQLDLLNINHENSSSFWPRSGGKRQGVSPTSPAAPAAPGHDDDVGPTPRARGVPCCFLAVSSIPKLKPHWIAGDVICAVVQLSFSRRKATVAATRKHGHLARARVILVAKLMATVASLSRLLLSTPDMTTPSPWPCHPLTILAPSLPPRRVCRCSRRPGAPQPAYSLDSGTRAVLMLRRMS
jgi:hypothetical protein